MKSEVLAICAGVLFFLLSPATFFRLPPKGSKFAVAAVHATLFAFIFYVGYKYVSPSIKEGLKCVANGGKIKETGTTARYTFNDDRDSNKKKGKDGRYPLNGNGTVTYKCVTPNSENGCGGDGCWVADSGVPSGNTGQFTNQNSLAGKYNLVKKT